MTSTPSNLYLPAGRKLSPPKVRWPAAATAARWPVYAWLLAFVVAPNLLLLLTSFMHASGGVVVYVPTLANYASVFTSRTVQVLAFKTLLMSAGAALLATMIAYPMAYAISRLLRGGKTVAAVMVVIPLWISLLMRDFAWRVILGERGLLNTVLVQGGVLAKPSSLFLYTPWSVVLTLTTVAIPYVFVAAYTAIERVPFSLVEAARDNGASPLRTFTTVVWPLTRQGTAIGMALAFLISAGDYVTPSMVGGIDGTTLGMVVSSQFGIVGNWPLGSAMAVYLLALVVAVLGVLFACTRSEGVLTEVDAGAAPHVVRWSGLSAPGKLGRVAGRIALGLPYLLLYAPLAVIGLFSFNDATTQSLPLKGLTLRWYLGLPADGSLLDALWRTLELAFTATAIAAVVGTGFAFVFAGWPGRVSALVGGLVALPLAIPGVVLGISMVMATSALGLHPGMGRLVLGHLVFVMPVVMLVVSARLRRVDPSFALASRDLGAGLWQTFWKIQLPMVRGAVIGGALLGFTMSMDEVVVTLFLSGAQPTLPVYVWNQTRFGFTPSVNAIFSCVGVVSLALIVAAQVLITPAGSRTKGP